MLEYFDFFFFFDCQIRGAQPIKERPGLVLLLKTKHRDE